MANASTHPSKNVIWCSDRRAGFHFDPAGEIQKELKSGIDLKDLGWPSEVQDNIDSFNRDSKAMFAFYCIGNAAIGIAVLVALLDVTNVFAAKGDAPKGRAAKGRAVKGLAWTNACLAVVRTPSPWWARSLILGSVCIRRFDDCIGDFHANHCQSYERR